MRRLAFGAVLFLALLGGLFLWWSSTRREPAHDDVDRGKEMEGGEGFQEGPKLDHKTLNGLKKLVLFVGHARSCHTFVASMLNAHPHDICSSA